MHIRQSTMFKPLTAFAILATASIVIVHGQEDYTVLTGNSGSSESTVEPTAVTTTDSNKDDNTSIFDGGLLIGALDIIDEGPLGFLFRPLTTILRPIFYFVDSILSPVLWLVRVILTPVIWLLNVILLPIHGVAGILNSISSLVSDLLSWLGNFIPQLLSNVSALVSYLLRAVEDDTGIQQRRARGIMDSMMGMAWTILSLPFRFINTIPSSTFIHHLLVWPLHYLFGGDSDSDLSAISDTVSSALMTVSESSQGALIDLLIYSWAAIKQYVLPAADAFIVWGSTSNLVPSDVQVMLRSAHTGYSLLHMFGVL